MKDHSPRRFGIKILFQENLLILTRIIFFRSTKKNISQVSKGFFEDPRHLANHFQYLSESPALDNMIKENLDKNLG